MAFVATILHAQADIGHVLVHRRAGVVFRIEADFYVKIRLVCNAKAVVTQRKICRRTIRVGNVVGNACAGKAVCAGFFQRNATE